MTIDRFLPPSRPLVLVLTSAKAGSGSGREEIPRLVQLLEQQAVTCRVLHRVDEFRSQLTDRSEFDETIVVAAGGDGTLSLAASLVLESRQKRGTRQKRVPVGESPNAGGDAEHALAEGLSEGFVQESADEADQDGILGLIPMPMGTENLVARQFGFTRSAEQVVRTIRQGQVRSIDTGLANGKLFLIMATSGFDAEVVRRLHLTRRGHIRRLSYLLPILRAIRNYSFPKLRVRVDGGDAIECAWAMVFNLPQYGGKLLIEPGAKDDDGVFDLIAFRSGSVFSGLRYVAEIWLGRHLNDATVVRRRGQTIEIEADAKVPFQLDGDYAGKLPLRIEMLSRSIRLIMPVNE